MKKTLLVKNGILVSANNTQEPSRGDVFIKGGVIEKIGENIEEKADKTIDAQGKYIMPGFIDMYCKICEGGYENRKNIKWVGQSAAAGGFTTLAVSPNTQPIVDNKTVVEYVYARTKPETKINIFPYGSITKKCEGEELAEIGEMAKADIVALSDGGSPIANTGLLRDVLMYSKMLDVAVVTICTDFSVQNGGIVNDGYMSTKLGLAGIPAEAEETVGGQFLRRFVDTFSRAHVPVNQVIHDVMRGAFQIVYFVHGDAADTLSRVDRHRGHFGNNDAGFGPVQHRGKSGVGKPGGQYAEDVQPLIVGQIDVLLFGDEDEGEFALLPQFLCQSEILFAKVHNGDVEFLYVVDELAVVFYKRTFDLGLFFRPVSVEILA